MVRLLLLAAGVVLCGALGLVVACTTDGPPPPTGSGNDTIVDNDATNGVRPPASQDASPDSPFAPVDGGYPAAPDGYSPIQNCGACTCEAGTYCFGGGSGYTTFSGACTPTTFGIGCQPVPAACATDASCDCLLQATAAQVPCYGVCVQNPTVGSGVPILYCPNP
jgi:hypothetical protein